jgi:tyrosyl-tRNA synthetase
MQDHSLLSELTWRGMLHQQTEGLSEHLRTRDMVSAYCGFDPTAPSLHVGNLVPVMGLVHAQRSGLRPVFLAGGGTGLIGDPSGKASERPLRSPEEIASNAEAIRKQLELFVDPSGKNGAVVRNNVKWLEPLPAIQFMRDVGKHFTVNYMLQKESVKARLDGGMSFTEFAYMLLQAYDYLQLHDELGVTLQVGGSDQFGNITAGVELVRRARSAEAHGLTFPLLTTAAGTKFGKTEAGAVWLDPERTSPYQFYQFWINTDDRDVGRMLRTFTLKSREEIEALDRVTAEQPEKRDAQRDLAADVTRRVHGDDALAAVQQVSQLLFGKGDARSLSEQALSLLAREIPVFQISHGTIDTNAVLETISSGENALFKSKGEAKRSVAQGGLYINGERVAAEPRSIEAGEFLPGKRLLIRKGSRNYALVVAS